MSRLSTLFLLMALLFGQAVVLEHEYDFAAHASGDTCTTCLHATPLSHAAVGAIALANPPLVVLTEFQFADSQLFAVASLAYRARAPPSALSA